MFAAFLGEIFHSRAVLATGALRDVGPWVRLCGRWGLLLLLLDATLPGAASVAEEPARLEVSAM